MIDNFENDYINWLFSLVGNQHKRRSYNRLLELMHHIEFMVTIFMDKNRAADGMDLRYRYCYYNDIPIMYKETISGQASILEVLIALSVRCEEDIMYDDAYGDRTGFWFWNMVGSLGLLQYSDRFFDQDAVEQILSDFMERNYAFNGEGGIFIINDGHDTRNDELWMLMHRYLAEEFI